ncbi:hypothetical protein [Erythrobacter sp.]|uniref:hypothetical protein n=1 Tax=Erythrobacter sp. TaxID=1042 RepID=UPI0025D47C00|nr:hypothetical protein [Erythrobacter sp.]
MTSATDVRQHSYSLVTGEDPTGAPQVIEFDGADPQIALDYVQRRLPGREIELFEDGRRLGTVKCTRDGYWLILPRHVLMHGA